MCKDPTKNDISAELLGVMSDIDDDEEIVDTQPVGRATPDFTKPITRVTNLREDKTARTCTLVKRARLRPACLLKGVVCHLQMQEVERGEEIGAQHLTAFRSSNNGAFPTCPTSTQRNDG